MDDDHFDERRPVEPRDAADDAGGDSARDPGLKVSPASPTDVEDELPDYQPGEGPGPTPGE